MRKARNFSISIKSCLLERVTVMDAGIVKNHSIQNQWHGRETLRMFARSYIRHTHRFTLNNTHLILLDITQIESITSRFNQ